MNILTLPAQIGVAEFDELHDNLPAWREVIRLLAAEWSDEPVQQMAEGTVLVALLGQTLVLKLYPPFLRDHFEFERAALVQLGGRLQVPTPQLLHSGEREGWPWLLMTQLHGQPLTAVWQALSEPHKCLLLHSLGALAAQVHAQPVGALAHLAPPWAGFVAAQRLKCPARQQRTGLPPHLLAQLDGFLGGPLPGSASRPTVILTGEYTPMNLLVRPDQPFQLAGMYDFGDGMLGPCEYDWLGPLAFLAAGHPLRCQAFFTGYGVAPDASQRLALLRLLLLHRYSNLNAQIALPHWQQAPSFEELAERLWGA
jgi:hygromycin-B 7''-O-kinase